MTVEEPTTCNGVGLLVVVTGVMASPLIEFVEYVVESVAPSVEVSVVPLMLRDT